MAPEKLADIGLIGLAVMGKNLVLNMCDKGFTVCVYNRTTSKVDEFLKEEPRGNLLGSHSIEELVSKLSKPRKVMLLVKAGDVVDAFINQLVPHLEQGDIIIDGGNSEYMHSDRRCKTLEQKGILFVGTGVSGGEDGARYGPSLMPGGNPKAWPAIKDIFQAICAKTEDNEPCCDWAGSYGSGHYVKMVHNGIEYGDMQLIAEAYHLLRQILKLDNQKISSIFKKWNEGPLASYLIEITSDITAFKDDKGEFLVDKILDKAGQKGTGKWTAITGLDLGSPVTLIAESVFSRALSSAKCDRVEASKLFPCSQDCLKERDALLSGDLEGFIEDISKALFASKIISYTQGFILLKQAKPAFGWDLNMGSIALMWRAGCIIRSRFLGDIKRAFENNPDLNSLMVDPLYFAQTLKECESAWRRVVARASLCGCPVPAFSSALSFFDGMKTEYLPANLIQAQRDYFGAHQFELLNDPGTFIHNNWTGHSGNTASTTYDV